MSTPQHDRLAHLVGAQERLIGARALDAANACLERGEPVATDFLDPFGRQVAAGVLGAIEEVSWKGYGGYNGAERQRLLVYPAYYLTELLEPPLRACAVQGDFSQVEVAQSDFLGAILATGLKRERVGDILPVENGCQVVLTEEALTIVLAQLHAVHRVPVQVTEIDLEQLAAAPQREKEINATVASMRLDAVAAFGFGISRTKMAREIKGERLKVNWKLVVNPAHVVAEGDVISMRGRGRLTIAQVKGETRKGRTVLLLKRTY